jgi:6-phosphofructokinase 2
MRSIVTLTLNPAIDGACEAQAVGPTHKIRTSNDRYNPGGGGINVARVVKRLGGKALAVYMAGGATGAVMDSLLDEHDIDRCRIDITGHTRISLNVHERTSGLEYRFVPEGPEISAAEVQACVDAMATIYCDFLVISGSVPRGAPPALYADLAATCVKRGARIVLDTSGPALGAALGGGNIFLVKPSRGELEKLVGRSLRTISDIETAARNLIATGQCENIAVTLGHEGALLVHKGGTFHLPALPVNASSAVGAGDSFVGGMVFALASGNSIEDAFRLGLAAATATVLSPGTDLCQKTDVDRLLLQVPSAPTSMPANP